MQLLVQESFLCSWPTEIGAPGSRRRVGGQLLTWWEIFFINEIGNLNRASQVDLLPDFEDFQFTKLDKVSNLRQNIWYLGNSNCVKPKWLARLWGFQKQAFYSETAFAVISITILHSPNHHRQTVQRWWKDHFLGGVMFPRPLWNQCVITSVIISIEEVTILECRTISWE